MMLIVKKDIDLYMYFRDIIILLYMAAQSLDSANETCIPTTVETRTLKPNKRLGN